jgi:hypothetical protein
MNRMLCDYAEAPHDVVFAHSSDRHSPGACETPADRISRAARDAVGEVGSGGEDTVIELHKHTAQDGPVRDPECAFAFPGLRCLRLVREILKRSTQSGPRNNGGPFLFSVAFATGIRV